MGLLLQEINFDLKKLENAGCQLAYPPALFQGLLKATHGDPCTTGCAYFDEGKCPAYRRYHSEARFQAAEAARTKEPLCKSDPFNLIGGQWAGMTSAQIMAKEGISRGEFQKRKQAGHYKK